jgi:hypothetical protein
VPRISTGRILSSGGGIEVRRILSRGLVIAQVSTGPGWNPAPARHRATDDRRLVRAVVDAGLLPASAVRASSARGHEPMDENDRNVHAGVLVIELDLVIGSQMWHGSPLAQNADARAERPASMVTTEPLV